MPRGKIGEADTSGRIGPHQLASCAIMAKCLRRIGFTEAPETAAAVTTNDEPQSPISGLFEHHIRHLAGTNPARIQQGFHWPKRCMIIATGQQRLIEQGHDPVLSGAADRWQ